MISVELFAGCGGLALGLARAGFRHVLVVERDDQAYQTLKDNRERQVEHFSKWPLRHGDVRDVDYSEITQEVALVAGGPPCQPFSIGGKHEGPSDVRNLWPESVRAVRELQPKAFLFENVRGLLRPAFEKYLEYLKLYFAWPDVSMKKGEEWSEHFRRLLRHAAIKKNGNAQYRVMVHAINTADYGAAQRRHRAIVLGVRVDVTTEWTFPQPTHSREALIWDQCVSQDYWKRHAVKKSDRLSPYEDDERLIEKLRSQLVGPTEAPWVTVRDAIGDLPEPIEDSEPIANHRLHPGARTYPRHTGSSWDEPAKALKAGDHGVPGGENILAPMDDEVRYFTLREMARLQGFPDEFEIGGTWKAPIKQLGNAVPVSVGEVLGRKILRLIGRTRRGSARVAA